MSSCDVSCVGVEVLGGVIDVVATEEVRVGEHGSAVEALGKAGVHSGGRWVLEVVGDKLSDRKEVLDV